MKKLILIHGRAQEGKDPVALQATWEEALDRGFRNAGLTRPAGLEIAFPYYGDTLDDLVREIEAPLVADVAERGAEPDADEATFREEFLQELADGAGVTKADIQALYDADVRRRGVRNWGWVQAILQALDRSQRFGEFALDSFTRDVFVYLAYSGVRRRIDAVVAPHISGDPCVVVAHSLGSVVGYNVLRESAHPGIRYVTVGSPLGIKAIKTRLRPPLKMPPTATVWFNAMDDRDVVALFPLDDRHFPTTPAIVNKTDVDNPTDDRHGIVGYLPDPDVARAIHAALTT